MAVWREKSRNLCCFLW